MTEGRKKVLEMLSEGKINAEEADRLLDRLSALDEKAPGGEVARPLDAAEQSGAPGQRKAPRFLRVVANSSDGDKVNVRVPIALIKTGIKLGALLPRQARQVMEEKGLDLSALSELDPDEMVRAFAELTVDAESSNGDSVQIFCE